MKTVRATAFSIVALMLISILASFGGLVAENENINSQLADEPVEMEATSPGHPVFAEYMGAHWCGPCITATNNLKNLYSTNGGGGTQSADFTFVSFWESQTSGWPADSPINRRSHIQNAPGYTGGIPVTVFGDAPSGTYYTVGGQSYDSYYQNGGNMHNANDYALSVTQSENGNNMDIEITAVYSGTGSKNVYLYAAVTEEKGYEPYTAGSGSDHPPNLWKKWLLNSGSNGFETFTLTSGTPVTKTWTVPTSTARAVSGISSADNFLTVAALLDGDHTSHRNVISAADSNMAPTIDVGVKTFTTNNPSAPNGGYINGDFIDLEATIVNNGVDAYSDGGSVKFFYKANNQPVYVGQTHSLATFANNGDTQIFNGQIDTTNIPESAYQTTFGVEISNLVADKSSNNNDATEIIPHDLEPVARKAQVIGSNEIERGDDFLVEAKTTFNDGVDTDTSFFTFELKVKSADETDWDLYPGIVTGGDEIFQAGTANEHTQFLVSPDMAMGAGYYDLQVRSIDSRSQESNWQITENAFELKNALPIINSEPVHSVKVESGDQSSLTVDPQDQRVDISANVMDAETDLKDLVITSDSPNFIGWHSETGEIEVYFDTIRFVNGQPAASGIEISVFDGIDTAFGTLLFNVVENGQPRWAGVEKQYVDEGTTASLFLLPYLSDTDENGNVVSAENLNIAIVDNTNEELLNLTLNGFTLNFATADDDITGETTLKIRASDGQSESDQLITIAINPINDAPRLNLSELEGLRLKVGTQKVIFLNEILSDVDGDVDDVYVTASNPTPGAARINILDNTLTLLWENEGMQTVTIQVEDRYDSNIYVLVVDVYDSMPLLVGDGPDADLRVSVSNVYIGEVPEVTMFLNMDDVTVTDLTTTWRLCNAEYCSLQEIHEHDITSKSVGWTFDPVKGQIDDSGMAPFHYIELAKVTAIASNGDKFEFKDSMKWTADEMPPGPDTMTDEEVVELVAELDAAIAKLNTEIEGLTEGTPEYEEAKVELNELEQERKDACEYTTCITQNSGSGEDVEESTLDLTVILAVIGVVIIALLAGLMFMRGGNGETSEVMVNWANELPSNDVVANSMYGGAQEIFQQPVAVPATVVQQVPPGAPPLPAGGLPAGWTMEQWAYYGHQYQQ